MPFPSTTLSDNQFSSLGHIDSSSFLADEHHLAMPQKSPKVLFLSDSYLQGICWAAFHLSLIRNLAAVSESLLAIRTNSFFKIATTTPYSESHLSTVIAAITKFKPDIVFSVNRCGLTPAVLQVIPANTRIITLFIDFADRCPEEFKRFDKRDFIWGTGIGALRDNFISKYQDVLSKDQVEFTLWCSDTAVFRPMGSQRDIDVCFVGTAFPVKSLSDLFNVASNSTHNLQILIDLYFEYRKQGGFDLAQALVLRGFDYGKIVEEWALQILTTDSHLQAIFADQISSEQRINCLSVLQDLKLEIYGEPQSTWLELIFTINANLLNSFKFKTIREESELVGLYNRSKINLNIQHDHARDCGLAIRVFDSFASKTLLVTHAISNVPLASLGFIDGEDYVSYSSLEELKEKCAYFVKNNHERERITESAFRKLLAAHTLRHRMSTIFAKAGFPDIAEQLLSFTDGQVDAGQTAEKIFCLDDFVQEEKIGKDYSLMLREDERFDFDSYLNPGELAIQFNAFRMVIPLYEIPIPGMFKRAGIQFLKYGAIALHKLGKLCRLPFSFAKIPD